jgi:hypothetical protein
MRLASIVTLDNCTLHRKARLGLQCKVFSPAQRLTSIAGATPPDWDVVYWDENLLQGPPPWEPFPEVVGITVHLTFANRSSRLKVV